MDRTIIFRYQMPEEIGGAISVSISLEGISRLIDKH